MPRKQRKSIKRRGICTGDMYHEIKLQNRSITPPLFGDDNFDETFADNSSVFAAIETVSGVTYFDGVNDRAVSHFFYIYYDSTVTQETWIEYNGNRYDILNVENYEERNELMKLVCNVRGANTIEATKL